MSAQADFDAALSNISMINRCNKKLDYWRGIYEELGVPLRYAEPTELEKLEFIRLQAKKYAADQKRKPKDK